MAAISAASSDNGWTAAAFLMTAIAFAIERAALKASQHRVEELAKVVETLQRRAQTPSATAPASVVTPPPSPAAAPSAPAAPVPSPRPAAVPHVPVRPVAVPPIAARTAAMPQARPTVKTAVTPGVPPTSAMPAAPADAASPVHPISPATPSTPAAPSTPYPSLPGPYDAPQPARAQTPPAAAAEPPQAAPTPPKPHLPVTAAPPAAARSVLDLEGLLGTNWLAKIGVAIFVIGFSFFLAWQLRQLGPLGKELVGLSVGVVLLAAGAWVEAKFQRYTILARAALAGGWALLFFVSYAAHHVAAARVIASPVAGLTVMLGVAAAMVAHTLRYRSEVVTGLAFLLAFTTIALNRTDVASLTANVVLAVGFSVIVVRLRWFRLELAGVVATYLNHLLWSWTTFGALHRQPPASVTMSAAILLLYWIIFRAAFIMRRPPDETPSVASGVLNSVLLLSVLRYETVGSHAGFLLLLILGAVDIALARLPMIRARRASFIALTTLGTALAVAAIPLHWTAQYVAPVWLVDAIVLIAVGIAARERVYRRIGNAVLAVTALQLFSFPIVTVASARFARGAATHEWTLGFIALSVVLALYAQPLWLQRRWQELFDRAVDMKASRVFGYGGAALLVIAGWLFFPGAGAAIFWAATAVLLALINRRQRHEDLAAQSFIVALMAYARVLMVDLPSGARAMTHPASLTWRLVTTVAVAALLYALARCHRIARMQAQRLARRLSPWAATSLLVLLTARELRPGYVALGWIALAVALSVAGRRLRSASFVLQANAVGALFVVSVASVNLPSSDAAWASSALTLRAVATVIAAAVLYLMSFWNSRSKVAHMRGVVIVPWWLAAGLVTALLWLELASSAVTISWILVAFTLAFIGRHFRNSHFMAQADVLAAVALGRFLAVDQYSYGPLTAGPVHVTWRAVTAILLATIVYLLSRWNREAGFKVPALLTTGLRAAGTAVLMLLAWRELQAPAVVVAWAATAAVLLFSARRFRLGDLLVQANAIGAAAIARVIIVNLPSNAVALPGIASWRALAVPLLCVVLYGLARWNDWTLIADDGGGAPTMPSSNGTSARGERLLRTVPLWCATGLVALLAWYELLPAAVAVAWTIVALVLLELGLRIASRDLLAQSSLLFYGAVVRVFVVNLNIADYGVFGARAYTVAPVVLALLYAYVRLADDGHVVSQRLASSFAWTGVITAAALVRFEVAADLVVVAWGALTLAVVAAASWSGRKVFLHAGLALAFATLVRGGVHNLYERSYFPAPGVFDAWLYLGGAALLLFCSLPFAFRLRSTAPIVENRPAVRIARWIAARPEQALFFIALVMITAVVTSEMRRGMLTLAWAVEGLAVFLVAVAVGERSYRLSGITLLLLCIAKIFLNDFWTLSLPDKALTGIVMGLALIAVSFLYTHKRDTILRYL